MQNVDKQYVYREIACTVVVVVVVIVIGGAENRKNIGCLDGPPFKYEQIEN